MRILLVEDCWIDREMVTVTLEPLDVEITSFESGEDALLAMADTHFDMAIVDLRLRYKISGDVVATAAHKKGIPVLIMTSEPELAPKGFPVLQKPVFMEEFFRIVEGQNMKWKDRNTLSENQRNAIKKLAVKVVSMIPIVIPMLSKHVAAAFVILVLGCGGGNPMIQESGEIGERCLWQVEVNEHGDPLVKLRGVCDLPLPVNGAVIETTGECSFSVIPSPLEVAPED